MTMHEGRLEAIADEERPGGDPPYVFPDYRSTVLRGPKEPLLILPHTLSETTGPAFGEGTVEELDADLTSRHAGEPRASASSSPAASRTTAATDPNTLVEVWRRTPPAATRIRSTSTRPRSTRTSPAQAAA